LDRRQASSLSSPHIIDNQQDKDKAGDLVMERVDIVRAPLFARLFIRINRELSAHLQRRPRISRIDPTSLSEDRLRDLGLMQGRRRRGDPDLFS
jgi:hypothetical protein